MIFSLERLLSRGTKLTWEHANKLGKPVLHIYDTRKEANIEPRFARLEIQALSDFVCSRKIEIVERGRSSGIEEPGVYDWTPTMLRFLDRAVSGTGSTTTAGQ